MSTDRRGGVIGRASWIPSGPNDWILQTRSSSSFPFCLFGLVLGWFSYATLTAAFHFAQLTYQLINQETPLLHPIMERNGLIRLLLVFVSYLLLGFFESQSEDLHT